MTELVTQIPKPGFQVVPDPSLITIVDGDIFTPENHSALCFNSGIQMFIYFLLYFSSIIAPPMGPHLRVPRPHIPVGEAPDTGMVKVEATTTGLQIIQLNSINVSRRKREVAATTTEAEIAVAVEAEVETEDPKIKTGTVEWKCSPYDNFWSPNFGPQFWLLPIPTTLIFFPSYLAYF